MSDQILTNHGAIDDAHLKVKGLLDQIRSTQQLLQNVDAALLAMWKGQGNSAMTNLSNENLTMLQAAIDQTEALNADLSAANQTFEQTDQALSGQMEG